MLTKIATLTLEVLKAQDEYKRYRVEFIKDNNDGREMNKHREFAEYKTNELDVMIGSLDPDVLQSEELYLYIVRFRKNQKRSFERKKIEFDGSGIRKLEDMIDQIQYRSNVKMELV